MNKEDLIKLRELLKKDELKVRYNMDLDQDYVTYYNSDGSIGEVYKGKDIISNKVPASIVADAIVNQYIKAIHAFQYFGFGTYTPVIAASLELVLKDTNGLRNSLYEDWHENTIPLADIVRVEILEDSMDYQDSNDVEPITPDTICELKKIPYQLEKREERKLGKIYHISEKEHNKYKKHIEAMEKFLTLPNDDKKQQRFFVSFDELIVELSSRGFYCNYNDFEQFKHSGEILYVSYEPIIEKSYNVDKIL